jgi:soluble lytic murein transglycosylase-like protein
MSIAMTIIAAVRRAPARSLLGFFAVVVCSWVGAGVGIAHASDARIFVIHEADGTIRFTNRMPPPGVEAQIFRARGDGGSYTRGFSYAGGARGRAKKIYPNLFSEAIRQAAQTHKVDPALIKAVIHAESAFNPRAVSPKGAIGLMQLMPSTARMLGVRNAFVPESNIEGGTSYLARLIRRYNNVEHALAAYNAGDLHVQRYNGIPPFSETQEYVRRVLQLKKQYSVSSHG